MTRAATLNSPEIHLSAIVLQHAPTIFTTVTCSSNRESLRTVSGGSGLSFFFQILVVMWDRVY